MQSFNGLGLNLGNLSRLSNAESRSLSAENPTGAKGQGGRHVDPNHGPSRDLGTGWKVRPCVGIKPGETLVLADVDGPGAIQQIWMTPTGNYRYTILRFYWDGEATPSVEVPKVAGRGAEWVRPDLVVEVAFAEFTAEGVVRHASFLGLREDKDADEVSIEKPKPAPPRKSAIKITNADRLIFPASKVTKGDLAAYYEAIGPAMAPWALNRPISLVRCPQGRGKKCFFQKHDAGSFGDAVGQVDIREKDGGVEPYLYAPTIGALVACVQMGTIEFHGWGSRIDDVEKPDRMVFDLDPDEGLDFGDVRRAAHDIRRTLDDLGLTSFAMLSGGKGLHVVVPLTPQAEWPEVKDFAQRFALALAENEPDRFVGTMSKAKRKGRIFIDWLRNQRGATAVLPYSARAREGAPVAAPIAWDELDKVKGGNDYSVEDVATLIARAASATLSGWGMADQELRDL